METKKDEHSSFIALQDGNDRRKVNRKLGLLLGGLTGVAGITLLGISYPFILPAFRKICLPYVPATTNQVNNVLKLLNNSGAKSVIDLGSGDGRIVLEAARKGYNAVGIELNPWLVLYSKIKSWYLGYHQECKFYVKDIWKTNLTSYDCIIIFGVDEMMEKLEQKFQKELNEDTKIIACRFPLKNQKPSQIIEEGIDSVWLYEKSGSFKNIEKNPAQ